MQDFKEIVYKYEADSKYTHTMYMKKHNVREKTAEKPINKTLFVVNVPPYCDESLLSELFSKYGQVKAVYISKSPTTSVQEPETSEFFKTQKSITGFKVAYIVFEQEADLAKALKLCGKKCLILTTPDKILNTGLKKWRQQYNDRIPDVQKLTEEIDSYMVKFDAEMKDVASKEKNLTEADEDGWVTVTKRGRRPGFSRKESVKQQILKKEEKQKGRKELVNFYKSQIRESKMKNLVAMRQKFEEDKKKIAALKQSRRFKPF